MEERPRCRVHEYKEGAEEDAHELLHYTSRKKSEVLAFHSERALDELVEHEADATQDQQRLQGEAARQQVQQDHVEVHKDQRASGPRSRMQHSMSVMLHDVNDDASAKPEMTQVLVGTVEVMPKANTEEEGHCHARGCHHNSEPLEIWVPRSLAALLHNQS